MILGLASYVVLHAHLLQLGLGAARVSGRLWYLINGYFLIWRLTSESPNRQIKTVAKISQYTVYASYWNVTLSRVIMTPHGRDRQRTLSLGPGYSE